MALLSTSDDFLPGPTNVEEPVQLLMKDAGRVCFYGLSCPSTSPFSMSAFKSKRKKIKCPTKVREDFIPRTSNKIECEMSWPSLMLT